MISGSVVILDHSPSVLCARSSTFVFVRQQSKKPACRDSYSPEKRKKRIHFPKSFPVLWRTLCHHRSQSPLSTSILKSPLDSHDHSLCNSCSKSILRIPNEVSTWQIFKVSPVTSVELARIQSLCNILIKQSKLESLKSSNP